MPPKKKTKAKPKSLKPKPGALLISEPFNPEPKFKRAVVLISQHDKRGTIGFILNKPIDVKLKGSIPDFTEYKGALFLGGPINKNQLFFIHTLGPQIEGSIEIMEGLHWGGEITQLKKMILAKKVKSSDFRFFAGYSGWRPKQLDNEFKTKSWIVAQAKPEQIMDENTNRLWSNILKTMGNEYAMLANFPENPSLN